MRALIFAAGRGERMRPLTDSTPKPLLEVRGKPLIAWHLERLADAGVHYVVVNTSHLAERFPQTLGDGSRWGLRIRYAYEGEEPLETGGGMLNALPLLGAEPFIAVSADVFTDFDFASLPATPRGLAHLVMVDNPPHHAEGDFALDGDRLESLSPRKRDRGEGSASPQPLTWSGIGVFRPEFLHGWRNVLGNTPGADAQPPRFKLRPLLDAAIARGEVTGIHYRGLWSDVGTPGRLLRLSSMLQRTAHEGKAPQRPED
jgi:MurNAc alpha-1-phosphate uridylyltransferase